MKIAIPSDDGVTIASHTGRASGFVIYDIKNNDVRRLEHRTNRYTGHALGECNDNTTHVGNQHHSHDSLLDALHDCEVMIAHGMGPRLVNDLASRNIRVMFCKETKTDDAANNLAVGKLLTTPEGNCHR